MPKKTKRGKNKKYQETRKFIYADTIGQVYGYCEKALGNRFFNVVCNDSKTRRCKVRNRRMRVNPQDIVIVSLRDFDDKNGDIIHKYKDEEIRLLKKENLIPEEFSNIDKSGDVSALDREASTGFSFDDL